mmetsp:Transcript_66650/g.148754  ORF Transcript_66650/g.148754 Transcript_66650/m.148754 type:complete len:110 (+) Transcript_66650:106-435(+)
MVPPTYAVSRTVLGQPGIAPARPMELQLQCAHAVLPPVGKENPPVLRGPDRSELTASVRIGLQLTHGNAIDREDLHPSAHKLRHEHVAITHRDTPRLLEAAGRAAGPPP